MKLLEKILEINDICKSAIQEVDKSDINSFGITYCDVSIRRDMNDIYYLYCRYHMWGSKKFVNQYGHYTGTFDSYYIKIDLNETNIKSRIIDYFINKEYKPKHE